MKTVEIYSSVMCPYCKKAKSQLNEAGVEFTNHEIILLPFGLRMLFPKYWEMRRRTGGKHSVPQILIDGEYFGDDDTLEEAIRAGTFLSLLERFG